MWIPDFTLVWKIPTAIVAREEGPDSTYEVNEVLPSGKTLKAYSHPQIIPVDPSPLVDMMNNMHEAPLLDLLHRRFAAKKI